MTAVRALARRVNLRHVGQRRLRAGLTVVGMAGGVALVLATLVLNHSVVESVRRSVLELAGGVDLEVAAAGPAGIDAAVTERLSNVEGVEAAAPVLRTLARVHAAGGESSLLVVGATPALATAMADTAGDLRVEGAIDDGGVVLATRSAATLGVDIGGEVQIVTPNGARAVPVSGLVSGGALSAANRGNIGLMSLATAQDVFGRPDAIDAVYLSIEPAADVGAVQAAAQAVVAGTGTVARPEERVGTLTQSYDVIATLMSAIGWIALVVALLVVHNTMGMSVTDRRRELAVARSLGASRTELMGALVIEGAVLGLAGAAIGIGLGVGMAALLLSEAAAVSGALLPVAPDPQLSVTTSHVATALVVGVVAASGGAALAARRIAGVDPVEALRPAAAHDPYSPSPERVRRTAAAGLALLSVSLVLGVIAVGGIVTHAWIANLWVLTWLVGFALAIPWLMPMVVTAVRPVLARAFGGIGRLAGDGLAHDPTRAAVCVAALALTLGMVVGIAGALRSYRHELRSSFEASYVAPLYVAPRAGDHHEHRAMLTVDVGDRIRQLEGVRYVSTFRGLDLEVDGDMIFTLVEPLRDVARHGPPEARAELSDRWAQAGTVGDDEIGVSRLFARRYGVTTGDTITLPTPSGPREFVVAGTFDGWGPSPTIAIDQSTYLREWGDRAVDELAIYVEPEADTDAVRRGIESLVHDSGLDARVLERGQAIDTVMSSVAGLLDMADGLLLVALVVAGITIANTAFAAVVERRWQLAMAQVVGVTRHQLTGALALEAVTLGVIGVVAAVAIGLVTAFVILTAADTVLALSIPFRPPPGLLAAVVTTGVVLSVAATLAPRRLTAQVPLIDSLRYE